ncbi:MAG TPA: PAS domain S-box protein [Candidatus Sulfotelmatobacter sp.]|nr:PAS domain S-box protein [Candidatus Sulfotelmatobacter sp.]
MNTERQSGAAPQLSPSKESDSSVDARLEKYEKRQRELWGLTFFLLLLISSVFAWLSWDTLRSTKFRLEALPIGLVILIALLGVYIWKKTHEIAELKGLMRGLDQKDSGPPSDRQLEQLFQMISKSQQGFRDLIDSFDDILLALSLEGEIRAANRSFADFVGQPFQEIIGLPLSHFVSDESGSSEDDLRRGMNRFLDRRIWSGVIQLRLKRTGSVFFFECVAHAMLREDKVHGLTIMARDITSQRRSEARFTELFETLQEGIYIITPDDKILEVNPALVRMLGYGSKEELLAKKVSEVFVDEEQRALLVREVNNQPSPQGREITLQRKDGQPVICLNTATAVRDTGGKIVRYQGALADVTERRSIEKRLYQQQEFARRLVDSFPDLIFVVDTQKRYTFVSPKVMEVLGYEPQEAIGMVFGDRTHAEERTAALSVFDDVIQGKRNFASIEIRVRHKLGEWRRLRCHFSPLFDVDGTIEGVVISGRDITEVKRLEEQLIQAEKLAAMGQMLAGVAHELNNPLTAILGASELLRERAGADENTKRQLEMTHRQARRAARIVQNLLEFSRPASPQKKALDLNFIIDRTLQLHEHSLRRNSIEVDFRSSPGLPSTIGDANQLIQVFLNLVSNAEQAIREIRPSGRIQIRLGQSGSRIFATVQDDGVGIKPETLPKLFDPFFTTKRPGGGTGLGLSICLSIVREHGGDIEVESLPAGGAAFTVFLPVAVSDAPKPPSRDADSSGNLMTPNLDLLKNRKILVLDDEESIRMLIVEGLSANGLLVDCAATAEEALSLVLREKYDAILCDLNLSGSGPNADGYSVAQRLKIAAGANKPELIYMSGEVIEEGQGSSASLSFRRLQKPFRISDVLNILTAIFSRVPAGSSTR